MKIFISYTTRDGKVTKDILEQLSKKLSSFETVFIDLIHNNSKNKQKRVFDELELADYLLLIETPSVYESNWVQAELERAKLFNKQIIKISIENLKDYFASELENLDKENYAEGQLLTTYIKNSASRC